MEGVKIVATAEFICRSSSSLLVLDVAAESDLYCLSERLSEVSVRDIPSDILKGYQSLWYERAIQLISTFSIERIVSPLLEASSVS